MLALAITFGVGPAARAWQEPALLQSSSGAIPAKEFSRIVSEFSEEGGSFRSDNFVSNETSYLYVLDRIRDLALSGGAYIGVGPEQNFTYIAKIRPKIAFIVDIRRQAMIQHLLYKAIFHLGKTRTQFLAYLFSKPINDEAMFARDLPVGQLLEYLSSCPTDYEVFECNLSLISKTIREEMGVDLSAADMGMLRYVYTAFRDRNLDIQYRTGASYWGGGVRGGFPTLSSLILSTDQYGNLGNFLASAEDYEFVRLMQEQNRIIPLVGDFAGTKALPDVAEYLHQNGYTVTAFYTSNVEQYLFAEGVFDKFAENVRRLPITEHSLFIRAFPNMRDPHPAGIPGHRLTTLLGYIKIFLKDYADGLYGDYWALVTTHFIAEKLH